MKDVSGRLLFRYALCICDWAETIKTCLFISRWGVASKVAGRFWDGAEAVTALANLIWWLSNFIKSVVWLPTRLVTFGAISALFLKKILIGILETKIVSLFSSLCRSLLGNKGNTQACSLFLYVCIGSALKA